MAYIQDKWRPSEDRDPSAPIPVSSGAASGSAAPTEAAPAVPTAPKTVAPGLNQAPGSNFPDLTAYLRANQGAAVGMGQQAAESLGSQAETAIGNVQAGGNYGGLSDIQGRIGHSGTEAGREGLIDDRFGAAPTPGGSRLDSYLVGQVGSGPLDDLRAKYGGLLSSVKPIPENLPSPTTIPVAPERGRPVPSRRPKAG